MGEEPATGAARLRRSIGTATATATSAGLAFAAFDYLGVVSVLAYAPGASAALAILVGGVLVLLVSGIFAELNGLYPTAAGIRLYLGRALGNRTALSVTLTYMTTVVLVIAADAFLIGAAVRHVLGEPRALAYVWIVALLGLALASNLKGVRLAGWLQTIVTYTVLTGTAVLSVIAVAHSGRTFHRPFDLFGKGAFSGVQAVAFALFLYAAFEWVTTTAEEARRPAVITRALFIAPVAIWLVTTLFALAMTHLLPFSEVHHSAYPQLLLGNAALGTVGELWMLALTLLTALNTFNGGFLVASRFIYAAAREGNLPRQFALLNLNAVPWLAVVDTRRHLGGDRGGRVRDRGLADARGRGGGDRGGYLRAGVGVPVDPAPQGDPGAALPARGGAPVGDLRGGAVQRAVPGDGVLGPAQRQSLLGRPDRDHPRAGRAVVRVRDGVRAAPAGGGRGAGGREAGAEEARAGGQGGVIHRRRHC